MEIMRHAGERFMWAKMQEEEQKLRGDEDVGTNVEEQMQVDTIDWYDFVVVEQIDLYDDVDMQAQEADDLA